MKKLFTRIMTAVVLMAMPALFYSCSEKDNNENNGNNGNGNGTPSGNYATYGSETFTLNGGFSESFDGISLIGLYSGTSDLETLNFAVVLETLGDILPGNYTINLADSNGIQVLCGTQFDDETDGDPCISGSIAITKTGDNYSINISGMTLSGKNLTVVYSGPVVPYGADLPELGTGTLTVNGESADMVYGIYLADSGNYIIGALSSTLSDALYIISPYDLSNGTYTIDNELTASISFGNNYYFPNAGTNFTVSHTGNTYTIEGAGDATSVMGSPATFSFTYTGLLIDPNEYFGKMTKWCRK